MKTAEKINLYSQLIQLIDYDNREGGKYAYVQYMSYMREILALLTPISSIREAVSYFSQTSEKFNEHLCGGFSEEQRVFFHSSRMKTLLLLQDIKLLVTETEGVNEEETWFRKAG